MFCKYCGNQIPDGEVCTCAEAAAAREAAAAPVTPAAQPTASPVATAVPAAGSDAGKVIGDAFKSMPDAARTLLKDNQGTGIALPAAIILGIGGLLLNILAWICMAGGIMGSLKGSLGTMVWPYVSKVFSGIYGYAILGGLWTCIIPIALSTCILLVGQLIRKEKLDILPALTTGICVNTLPAVIFLVGALITLLIPAVGYIVILVGIVAALAANYKLLGKLVPDTNGVIGTLIASAIVAVIAALMAWIIYGVLTGYIENSLIKNFATILGENISGIEDILSMLIGGF